MASLMASIILLQLARIRHRLFDKYGSLNCVLFCYKARRKRPEYEKSVGRNTRLRLVFLPTLLKCSSRFEFLSALQQNRAQSRLLYLFYNKESVKFPTHYFQFSKQF